ncbi:MAG: RNA polymerase sigma-54 factor [Candidatus Marinimicrobia bacterium]|nr:RNA polymerase sigma-54 factor [Candidatus Neomarinimicrobiota bacterium]|tara:strand:+ start:12142 stop:13503 length:1362 start_codon:yes stop_codon:yes gene_type:complete
MSKLSQIQEQKQKLSPQQIVFTTLLQLNVEDLEKKIIKELEENPVLELVDINLKSDLENENKETDDKDWEEMNDVDDEYIKPSLNKNNFDFISFQKQKNTFTENLIMQLEQLNLTKDDKIIAESLIWNINDEGYLLADLELIAERMEVEVSKVEKLLKIIQKFEPLGVGSRNLKECLNIQINKKTKNILSKEIIKNHFDDFSNKRFNKIQMKLNCSSEELNKAINIISSLNPKPGDGSQNNSNFAIPDLIVDEIEGKLVVSLNDGNFPEIKISPVYQEMFFTKNNNEKKLDKFLKDKIESANWLIQAIQKREITIMKVMNEIIKIQSDFFEGKIRSIKPLILKDIADKINMDISTVSRVTNGKYVQTPWGVYELKHFFSDKLINNYGEKVSTKNIKLLIEDIIKKEDKNNPLSDEIISKLVYEKGFTIARRTISKYREQLNIPIARLRRMLVN